MKITGHIIFTLAKFAGLQSNAKMIAMKISNLLFSASTISKLTAETKGVDKK
jgi:hypothetical protein